MKMSDLKREEITILELVDESTYANNICIYNTNFANFGEICRLCLGYENMKPIFNMSYKQVSIQNIIFDCSSLKVEVNDCLPQQICANCLAELIRCYNFKEKCIQIENILIDIYNNKDTNKEQTNIYKANSSVNENNFIEEKENVEQTPVNNTIDLNNEKCDDVLTLNVKCNSESEIGDNGNVSDSSTYSNIKGKKKRRTKRITIKKGGKSQGPPFKCRDCTESYDTQEELKEHRKTIKHPETRNSSCSICNKSFTRSKLKQHMRVHTKEKPFVCKICSQAFSMSGNLKRHMMTHTGERPHVCEICGKGFIQATTLHIHRRTHTSNQYVSLEGCDSQNITCEICGRGFKRSARYKNHLTRHFLIDEKVPKQTTPTPKNKSTVGEYVCDICKRTYKTKHLLKAHQLTHGEKTYLCSDCGKSFLTKAALQSHLKVHTGERPHTCTVCKKSFAHVGSFEAHMLIHTGRRPYNCKLCSKTFTQLSHLKYHSRTHSGERPYSCNYCDKKFALKGNLTVHIRIHTGETPYLCPECGKGFYDSSSMKKHRVMHGNSGELITEVSMEKQEYDQRNSLLNDTQPA